MNLNNEVFLVANDNGYAAHKLAWYVDGKIQTSKVSTAIAMGHTSTSTMGEKQNAYSVDGTRYTCTENSSDLINLRHANYPFSVENRVIFTHAIDNFGLSGHRITAAVTLPYGDYFKEDGKINVDFVEKTAANFSVANVSIVAGENSFLDIERIQVTPEAISAWFDWAMDESGSMNENYEGMNQSDGSVLIIDIGGSTTDIVSVTMFGGALSIGTTKSETARIGVLDAIDELHSEVFSKLKEDGVVGFGGHTERLTQKTMSEIMRTGKARLAGKFYDFTEQRDKACNDTASQVINFIRRVAGSTIEYYEIVFVGGGSVVLGSQMKIMMPNATFLDEYANCRGALKFMRSQQGQD